MNASTINATNRTGLIPNKWSSPYPAAPSTAIATMKPKNPTTFSHELNGTGIAKLGLLDAEKITQLTGDLRIVHHGQSA